MATVGNWFAFGHPTVKEGVLGQLTNLLGYVGSLFSGQGITGYISDSGSVYLFDNAQSAKLRAAGLKGYNSEADAIANPNENITQAQIQLILNSHPTVEQDSSPGSQISNTVGAPVKSALSGLDAIGHFFNSLGELNTWIRVSKVVVGGVLLISGIVHLAGIDKQAIGIAGKAVLPGKI